MSNSNRFYPCDKQSFPAVEQYDYTTNIPVRSINDREFRWEDVAVKSIYLMQEATINGSFETTSYSYTSGVEFLTTYTGVDTASYTGWSVSGGDTVYIPESGVLVESGTLPNTDTNFYITPIDGNEGIGLFCTGESEYPKIQSDPITVGTDIGDVVLGNTHQLYFNSKLNYGTNGQLQVVLRGLQGTGVAWYDTGSSSWSASRTTGTFSLSEDGIDTFKYPFATSTTDWPAGVPTSFDLQIINETSGTFVTIDNVHIDTLMQKNAFIDLLVPSGYMLQVTPDIGWHDIKSMFDSTFDLPNPHLRTLGPFSTSLANLEDNLDNSLTATIDDLDFRSIVQGNFTKYLWRALSITENNQIGEGGLPARFDYVGDVIDSQFTVNEVLEKDIGTEKVITGTKATGMSIIIDGIVDFPGLSYPTPTTWKLIYNLSSTNRELSIKAVNDSGTSSSIRKILLTNKLYEVNSIALWNAFDEHGLVADIERLSGESNTDYADRIRRSYKDRGGPQFRGVINGALTELALDKTENAIDVSINTNSANTAVLQTLEYEVTAYSCRFRAGSFVYTERCKVDPIHSTVDLKYLPFGIPLSIKSDTGAELDTNKIELQLSENTTDLVYRYKLNESGLTYVTITYNYVLELLFKTYTNLGSLTSKISSITDHANNNLFIATISPLLSGNELTLGLFLTSGLITQSEKLSLAWSPIVMKKISEIGYKDLIKQGLDTIKQSDFYILVKELKDGLKVFWGSVEADRDRWDAADSKLLAMDAIPTLFDPPLSKILDISSGKDIRIEPVEAWGRGFISLDNNALTNEGLSSDLFQPGVATKNDLSPDLYITTNKANLVSHLEANITQVQNNNNVVIFSGQI
jgi:3D (Asp-Asp-Asp) domain-containing protein